MVMPPSTMKFWPVAYLESSLASHSTMLAIMGRMAAYTGQQVTWDDALNSQEHIFPAQLDWNMSMPVAPMPRPGVTKLG